MSAVTCRYATIADWEWDIPANHRAATLQETCRLSMTSVQQHLRLPGRLYRLLRRSAKAQRRSLNAQVVHLLEQESAMPVAKGPKGVRQELHKFKAGTLHSGSKKGPVVTNRKQAIAIALSEAGMSKRSRTHKGY